MADGLGAAEQPHKACGLCTGSVHQGLLGGIKAGAGAVIGRYGLHPGALGRQLLGQPLPTAVAAQQQHAGAGPIAPG